MPKRASIGALSRAFSQIIGVSAGEAGLLGACSAYSDTLLVESTLRLGVQHICDRLRRLAGA
jgi:hypothetical protein